MKKLFALLEHQNKDIRRQVCEILSKIASRSSLVGYVIENPDHFEKIIKIVSDKDFEVIKTKGFPLFIVVIEPNKSS